MAVDFTDDSQLGFLDLKGVVELAAVARAPHPPSLGTLSKPAPFVCSDGTVYWCKGNTPQAQVQQGLMAELVAGRLAERTAVGGPAAVVRIDQSLVPPDGTLDHLVGTVVGVRHFDNMEHVRTLQMLLSGGAVPAGSVDPLSRARVIAFQTWIGANDSQLMIGISNGRVVSIDHGDCFGNLAVPSQPSVVITPIPGLPEQHCKDRAYLDAVLGPIEALSDEDLLIAVARVPNSGAWNADSGRRLAVARWLADRRDKLRGVMTQWMTT